LINDPVLSHFAGMISHSSGTSPTETLHMLGLLKSQNPNMGATGLQDIMLSGIGIGQHGAFNWKELANNPELFTQVGKMGGDIPKAYSTTFGVASILKKRTGNLDMANTQITGLIRALDLSHMEGINYGTYKGGRLQDFRAALVNAASTNPDALAHPFHRTEAHEGIIGLRAQAGVTDTDTQEQAKVKLRELIDAETNHKMSIEELTKFNEESIVSQDRLTASFNNLSDQLKGPLFSVLGQFATKLDGFVSIITQNKDEIGRVFGDVISITGNLALGLGALMVSVASLLNNPILKAALGLAIAPYMAEGSMLKNKIAQEKAERDSLATTLETQNLDDAVVGPDGLTAKGRIKKQYQDILASIPKDEEQLKRDQVMSDALAKIPDAMTDATKLMETMFAKLRTSIDLNTAAKAAEPVPDRDKNGN
jgi:hypothetical protein